MLLSFPILSLFFLSLFHSQLGNGFSRYSPLFFILNAPSQLWVNKEKPSKVNANTCRVGVDMELP